MNIKTLLLTLFTALCCTLTSWGAEIPSEYMGKWVTLKTENGYYFYAIEEDGQVKLGQTQMAPTSANYAAYCWKIEGDATDGYTFRCLKYQDQGTDKEMFITNPQNLATNTEEQGRRIL